jgi:cell division septation protein DedD
MAKPRVVESTPTAPAPRRVEQAVKEEKKAPVEKVKTETPKAVKAVKAVKKAAETKKVAASKRILPGSALVLNIASFSSLPEAQVLVGKLKKAGYNAYITGFMKDSVRWHRVRVGFFSSRTEATRAGRSIQSKFRVDKPWIAKPDASELKAHL